jgi:hypothetical protein
VVPGAVPSAGIGPTGVPHSGTTTQVVGQQGWQRRRDQRHASAVSKPMVRITAHTTTGLITLRKSFRMEEFSNSSKMVIQDGIQGRTDRRREAGMAQTKPAMRMQTRD